MLLTRLPPTLAIAAATTVLSFASLSLAAKVPTVSDQSTIDSDPGIWPDNNAAGFIKGWSSLPDVPGATIDTTSVKVGTGGATLTNYITADVDPSKIKRAVIQIHGANRDAWNQWIYANLSLSRAVAGGDVQEDEVVIMAPEFFSEADKGAYPVDAQGKSSSSAIVWEDNTWADGILADYPTDTTMGSFDALDGAVNYFLSEDRFPNLVTLVIAGFSLGAQLVQRYSVLRPLNPDQDSKINYWISSPNSFLYLNASRPLPTDGCSDYDIYKYGLEIGLPAYVTDSRNDTSETAFAPALLDRKIAYFVGGDDHIAGTYECEAAVQGKVHVDKMLYWVRQGVPFIPGSTGEYAVLPANSSFAMVPGVSHQDFRMIQSDPGVQHLFLEDYAARGSNANAPASNGLVADTAGVTIAAASSAAAATTTTTASSSTTTSTANTSASTSSGFITSTTRTGTNTASSSTSANTLSSSSSSSSKSNSSSSANTRSSTPTWLSMTTLLLITTAVATQCL